MTDLQSPPPAFAPTRRSVRPAPGQPIEVAVVPGHGHSHDGGQPRAASNSGGQVHRQSIHPGRAPQPPVSHPAYAPVSHV